MPELTGPTQAANCARAVHCADTINSRPGWICTLWHGHYNESGKPAMVMAVQDAGFYEHIRTLNIQFTGLKTTGREYKA
jgi:hypothetical protein